MKKMKHMLWFLPLSALLLFCLPYLLNVERFRESLEVRIGRDSGVEPHIGRLAWGWFPRPHITLEQVRLAHEVGEAAVERIQVFPDLGALVRGEVAMGSVYIFGPDITVRSMDALQDMIDEARRSVVPPSSIRSLTFRVAKGRLSLPFNGLLAPREQTLPSLIVSDIEIGFTGSPEAFFLHAGFRTSYSEAVAVELTLGQGRRGHRPWDLLVQGQGVALKPIRDLLLAVLGAEHPANRAWTGIVRSGHLRKGTFCFKGNGDQWHDLSRMTATADLVRANIHVPGTGIVLDRVSGQLRLENARLIGENIHAVTGKSVGTDGSFCLGLKPSDQPFELDVDLAVDVSDLPDVLKEFMVRPGWEEALEQFEHPEGRGVAHLRLGDRLGELRPRITVSELKATWFDGKIKEPMAVHGATLTLDAEALTWENLSGAIGSTVVHDSSGRVAWDEDVSLNVRRLEASLDTRPLYDHLSAVPSLKSQIQPLVTGMDGTLKLRDVTLRGRLNRPETFVYQGLASSEELMVQVPGFSNTLRLVIPGLYLSDRSIRAEDVAVHTGDQALSLSGRYDKVGSSESEGTLTLRGTVSEASTEWLRSMGWIPEVLFPRLPCDLAPLSLNWRKNHLAVSGTIRHRDDQGPVVVSIGAIEIDSTATRVRGLVVEDGRNRAEVQAVIPADRDRDPLPITLDFNGCVTGESLEIVFEEARGVNGALDGTFHVIWPREDQSPIRLDGQGEIRDVQMVLADQTRLYLTHAAIRGESESADWNLKELTVFRRPTEKRPLHHPIRIPTLDGRLSFLPGQKTRVSIQSGTACGISVRGDLDIPSLTMDLNFASGPEAPLFFEQLFECLDESGILITGQVSFDAHVSGTPTRIAQGAFSGYASRGVIDQAPVLSKVFALLDVTELFSNNPIDHLMAGGYRYDSIEITGTVTDHVVHIERAQIIGAGINFFVSGDIDLETKALDLVVLSSPFKNVDSLVDHIPIIGRFLGGKNRSILSVPVKVEGSLADPRPRILPRSLSNVSSAILDTFVKTFKLPFELSYDLVTGKEP